MAVTAIAADAELRDQLSNLRGLLVVSMLMTESDCEEQILELAVGSVSGLAPSCHIEGLHADGFWRPTCTCLGQRLPPPVQDQLLVLTGIGGAMEAPQGRWAWAYPLRSSGYSEIGR